MLESSTIFGDLKDMKRVRPDQEIAGIDSRRYQFTEKSTAGLFTAGAPDAKAEGEVWIAKDGEFVTKYVINVEVKDGGVASLDPTLSEGTLHLTFEILEANSDLVIELPEDAVSGTSLAGFEEGFPLPEGAAITAATGQFAMFTANMPADELQAFFEEEMAKLGWTKDDSGSMSFGEMVSLAFSKDGRRVSIMIQPDAESGATNIMVNAE